MLQAFDEVFSQQFGHQICWPCVQLAVNVDADAVEEGLVPVLASDGAGFGVGLADVSDHAECPVQVVADGVGFDLGGFQVSVGLAEFAGDAVLLSLQHVDADGVVEVGLQDLVPLDLESRDALGLLLSLVLGVGGAMVQRLVDELPDSALPLRAELDGGVVIDDLLLDDVYRQVRQLALGAVLLMTQTEEVVVEPAATSPGAGEAQS